MGKRELWGCVRVKPDHEDAWCDTHLTEAEAKAKAPRYDKQCRGEGSDWAGWRVVARPMNTRPSGAGGVA